MNRLLSLSAVTLSFLAVGCTSALSGGGLAGRTVNDGLPSGATIYTWDYDEHSSKEGNAVPGTESDKQWDTIWVTWDAPVPCSDIKGVDWWVGSESDGEMGLPLVNATYGNKYIPPPPSGISWIRPELWVDMDYYGNRQGDFTRQEAQALADHCGVELQMRR